MTKRTYLLSLVTDTSMLQVSLTFCAETLNF